MLIPEEDMRQAKIRSHGMRCVGCKPHYEIVGGYPSAKWVNDARHVRCDVGKTISSSVCDSTF